ncbi:MFS transporter [Chitinimonas sp. BJYL2]|uniref:MFS transporter n=1 Tax=Chitinimonas sp. BJYL2 TaxID=2976696 RepID=UPI0022B51E32|nr:MFS transporter [Chitinimonas sp. BJYL2]
MSASSLLRHRPFLLLWLGSMAASLGLAVALLAETWYAVQVLKLEAQLGYVLLAGTLPRLLLMALGGVLADRLPRGKLMAGSFVARALLLMLMGWLIAQGWLGFAELLIMAALYGVLDALFWPARDAILPQLLSGNALTQANAWMLATNQLGLVLGPMVGSALLAWHDFPMVFALTGVLMLAGAIACAAIVISPAGQRIHTDMWQSLREGLACAWHTPVLRWILLIYAFANLLFMGPMGLAPALLAAKLEGGSATVLAQLQSALSAGMLVGGILLGLYPPRRKRLLMICGLIAIEGVLLALLPQSTALGATLIQLLIGLCIAGNNVPMLSLLQQHTPPDKIGRVMSLNSMASLGLTPVAYGLCSLLLAGGVSLGWLAAGGGLLLAALCILLPLCVRTLRQTD